MLSEIIINDKTISLLFSRVIENSVYNQKYGSISLYEYNIDEITALSIEDDNYYPKQILTDLIHYLVEIVKADTVLKKVYSFSVSLKRKYENPNDIQYFKKEIEIIILSVDDIINITDILTTSINNIRG